MKLRFFQRMVNRRFEISVRTEDWSEGDLALMTKFGEPEIEAGGTFAYEFGGEPHAAELDNYLLRIKSRMPYSRMFDGRDFEGGTAEAEAAGLAWKDMVSGRISSAVTALRSNDGSFVTETVTEI